MTKIFVLIGKNIRRERQFWDGPTISKMARASGVVYVLAFLGSALCTKYQDSVSVILVSFHASYGCGFVYPRFDQHGCV